MPRFPKSEPKLAACSCPVCVAITALFPTGSSWPVGKPPQYVPGADGRGIAHEVAERVAKMEQHRRAYAVPPMLGEETDAEKQHRLGIAEGLRMAIDFLRQGTAIPDPAPPIKRERKKKEEAPFSVKSLGSAKKPFVLEHKPNKCASRILQTLTQRRDMATTLDQLSILTGYKQSGSFGGALADLRAEGLIEGLTVTEAGAELARSLGPIEPYPRGPKLLAFWMRRLKKAEARMLEAIVEARSGISDDDLAEQLGYQKSGSFGGGLAKLRKLELISKRGNMANNIFYEKGKR